MVKKLTCCVLILMMMPFLMDAPARGQIYENVHRPRNPSWHQLNTPHFRIIFQEGEEKAALKSASVLEDQYPIVQSLIGGSLTAMPVVLNGQNDLSNGYVTTQNFRIEVEIPGIKGKSMNPSDGNWLNTVMPHELVHALHLNVIPVFGVSGFLRPFSPDLARTMHFAAPLGMIEGIAVFHESHRQYGLSGRGNHPYFTQQHEAIFNSRYRWSLSRMLTDPVGHFPFDRHYNGGNEFIHWLQYGYGMETTGKTIRFVSRWPFLGYGTALWYHTGKRPSVLYREFEKQKQEIYAAVSDSHDAVSFSAASEYPGKGARSLSASSDTFAIQKKDTPLYYRPIEIDAGRVRRPLWISDHDILFYAQSYSRRPGFYTWNISNQKAELLLETRTVEDFHFSLHDGRDRFLYARYHRHPYYHNHFRMKVHEVKLENKTRKWISNSLHAGTVSSAGSGLRFRIQDESHFDRLHAPTYGPDSTIWALQTHHESNLIVQLEKGNDGLYLMADTLLVPEKGHIIGMSFFPDNPDSLVLLANRKGLQGFWFLHKDHLQAFHQSAPQISFDQGSVYDPSWHPSGQRILFTSDYNGRMNLYEYDFKKDNIYQLTDHRYGVMEGAYSPDGSRIAAVQIREDRFELVLIDKDRLTAEILADEVWKDAPLEGPSPEPWIPPEWGQDGLLPDGWSLSPYRTGIAWLRPRAFFPYWENESLFIGNRFGATLSGGDILRRNSYFTEASISNNRLWYDFEYQHTGFFPGFRIKGYQRPAQTTNFLLERQGAGIDIPVRIHFDKNTRFSSIYIKPGVDHFRERVITTGGKAETGWFNRTSASLFISWQHRLQQNIRDVQPNTGWIIFSEISHDIQTNTGPGLSAIRSGIYRFLSHSRSGNRSLRIGMEMVSQNRPYFDISGFYSQGFVDNVLYGANNAGRFNTRYTIPLWHIDRGRVLLPFFLDRFYLVLFSDTVLPMLNSGEQGLLQNTRSLFGGGLRLQLRLFNIPLDIGVAAAYEPTRKNHGVIMGGF